MILISFITFLVSFILIGVLSTLKSKGTSADYLLASHSEKPWMIALATVATNNSGYMFMGMIGYAYINGISVIWIMICALTGDFCASLFVHKKLRIAAGKSHALSFPEALSKWQGADYKKFRLLASLILVVFLSVYAAAQFKAGGKALHIIFNFDYEVGALIGAIIVLCYCLAGGIRASIWTNTAQSFVMIAAMGSLFFLSVKEIGGLAIFFEKISAVSPQFSDLYPQGLFVQNLFGLFCFIFGWFFGGFGIVGQPHIMTSFMAMNKPENIKRIRIYYYSWYVLFYLFTIGCGLAARLLIPYTAGFDAELAMPQLTQQIMPEILIGLVLAGLFSATMSTADSQILSCAGSITNDLMPKHRSNYLVAKIATLMVTIVAVIFSLTDNQSVFSLAMIAWLALACSFGGVITIYALGYKMSERLAIAVMLSGFFSMLIWRAFGLGSAFYEGGAGMMISFLVFLIAKKIKFFN